MPAMRKKRKDAIRACLYVSLPDGSVPKEILDGKLAIGRAELDLILPGGRRHRVCVKSPSPHVRLYALNRPLEEIKTQHAAMVLELLDLRSRLMLMAMRLGLKSRVPSSRNKLTWLQLADLIRVRLVQLTSYSVILPEAILGPRSRGTSVVDESLASMVRKKGN